MINVGVAALDERGMKHRVQVNEVRGTSSDDANDAAWKLGLCMEMGGVRYVDDTRGQRATSR